MKNTDKDVYAIVTNKIINLLDQGIIPWRKPWHGRGIPCNLVTMKPYRGINVMLLNMLGYKRNYFLSFNQVKAIGGSVKKNEKSQIVVFWKYPNKKEEEQNEETIGKKPNLYSAITTSSTSSNVPVFPNVSSHPLLKTRMTLLQPVMKSF